MMAPRSRPGGCVPPRRASLPVEVYVVALWVTPGVFEVADWRVRVEGAVRLL